MIIFSLLYKLHMGNVFPFIVPPSTIPMLLHSNFPLMEAMLQFIFWNTVKEFASLLPSPLSWTRTGFLSMQVSPWETEKNHTVSDLASMVDVPLLGSCVLREMFLQAGHCCVSATFSVFSSVFEEEGRPGYGSSSTSFFPSINLLNHSKTWMCDKDSLP